MAGKTAQSDAGKKGQQSVDPSWKIDWWFRQHPVTHVYRFLMPTKYISRCFLDYSLPSLSHPHPHHILEMFNVTISPSIASIIRILSLLGSKYENTLVQINLPLLVLCSFSAHFMNSDFPLKRPESGNNSSISAKRKNNDSWILLPSVKNCL